MLLLQDQRKEGLFIINELEAQLLKEKEARSTVEEQLSTKKQALRKSKVGCLLLGRVCQSVTSQCLSQ